MEQYIKFHFENGDTECGTATFPQNDNELLVIKDNKSLETRLRNLNTETYMYVTEGVGLWFETEELMKANIKG
ncbi:hypothetical protein [Mammaliicoccus sciuri]|uniref:hypothetical protein n=1 Tax=Mammaliicoccus sciuri TaxID=1296 RepID=UPI002DBB0980|nr:hypothetical protein [Mammaliicoccus sciuri]MEB6232501.1 hypothetical protein [Mammaliicoccus sciuri]